MHRVLFRPLLTLAYTATLCLGAASAFADRSTPFPEVRRPSFPTYEQMEMQGYYRSEEAYLSRIQGAAYYHAIAISDTGKTVQLHDTSKWTVNPKHVNIILDWAANDDIFIKPNASCWSSYQYVLNNRTTRQTIEVNLQETPLPMGAYTFRIVKIDPYNYLVQLSNANGDTVWKIDPRDSNFPYWQAGQHILVGVNNNWREAQLPHVLINVDLYRQPYSQASFYGYPTGY